MKRDILFVVDEQMYGGISVVLTTLLKKINYDKYNIDLLILHNRGNSLTLEKLPKSVNIIYGTCFFSAIDLTVPQILKSKKISTIVHKINIVFRMKTGIIKNKILKERKKILNKKYNVEVAFKDGFCALFTAFGDSDKKISWLHTSYDVCDYTSKYRKLFNEVYKKIDNIVAITQDVSYTFNKIYKMESKTKVIENLIDIDGIIEKSKQEFDDANFQKECLNLICVGRIAQQKAYPRLLYQMSKLKKEGLLENVILHIIGDGEEAEIVNKVILDNNLSDNVNVLGYKENPYPYIAHSDMLVLTSLYEGLGLVLIEANLLGVPCIATKFANVDKTLNDGEYGLIVDNSDEGIYYGLKSILESKEMLKIYNRNLKKYKYNKNEDIMKKIEKLFEK